MLKRFLFYKSVYFFSILSVINLNAQEPLIIFHFDFNSVSLKKDYIQKWLKKASDMGYNAVLWEVEDEIKWETCPECVSPDAFSKDEFKEILAYSKSLGLEPIPLLQTIGHGEYVLQNEKYFPLREDLNRYDCYCTSNKDVKKFLMKWVDEYLELFGELKYFHLGGDEAYAFASCKICKSTANEIGENKLYADYLTEIAKPILDKGIRPGVWSDMLLSNPNEINVLPKEFIIWDWNYWDGDSALERVMVWGKGRFAKDEIDKTIIDNFPEIFDNNKNLRSFYTSDFLKRNGYDVVLCSTSRSHGDGFFAGRNNLHSENIIGAARKSSKENLLGTCVTNWAVRIPNFETQEQWFYLAPLTIKNPSFTYNELIKTTSIALFDFNGTELFDDFNKIGFSFPLANTNTTGIMWTGLKDSKPAPNNYINELIARWKANEQFSTNAEIIKSSVDIIAKGIYDFNLHIPKANSGFEILNNWSKAGYFNYWQSIIANEIINVESGKSSNKKEEFVKLLYSLKKEYINWASSWMTDKSADQNACLIYDSIIYYFLNQ
ncbi:MAG: family 20 glycosylhydrolase [Ignavibacteriae bacterium]|nr:family 20 glycosylhydrolase [Ignavibacteriota bacterium]